LGSLFYIGADSSAYATARSARFGQLEYFEGPRKAGGDVHSLLYPGNNTLILAETQFWWCFGEDASVQNATVTVDGQTFFVNQTCPIDNQPRAFWSSHLVIGYDSNDQNKTDAVAEDLWQRGFDGVVGDWSGDSNTCKTGTGAYAGNQPFNGPCATIVTTNDESYKKFANSADSLHPDLKPALMYDESAYKFTQCNVRDVYQPQCIQNKILADSGVLMTNWFTEPNYLRWNGQPVVMFLSGRTLSISRNATATMQTETPFSATLQGTTCATEEPRAGVHCGMECERIS
jgi:hypothetical protein